MVAPVVATSSSVSATAGPRKNSKSKTAPPCGIRGQLTCGFRCVPELPAFECSASNVAPHSLPPEALTFEPPPDVVITPFKNGDKERKIHCNTELQDLELRKLAEMREEARSKGLAFMPSVAVMATRFLSRARNDAKKALKLMQATEEWRESYFKDGPVQDDAALREDMSHGVVYFAGRDVALRPALVIRATRIPKQWYKEKSVDKLIRVLIFCMEYMIRYMLVPGRVENLSVIVDLKGLGISQVPLSALSEVYKVMSHHYIGRVFKFYVCNASPMLHTIAGVVKAMLTDRQQQKLQVLRDVSELSREFHSHQLEKDLGGSRDAIRTFFPFPLQPGPLLPDQGQNAGTRNVAVPTAVSGVHTVLTADGALGRLWDPTLSHEENTRLEYAPGAAAVLRRCGLKLPPEFLLPSPEAVDGNGDDGCSYPHQGEPSQQAEDESTKLECSRLSTCTTNAGSIGDDTTGAASPSPDDFSFEEQDFDLLGSGAKKESAEPPSLQDEAVGSAGGLFSCRPCWCSSI